MSTTSYDTLYRDTPEVRRAARRYISGKDCPTLQDIAVEFGRSPTNVSWQRAVRAQIPDELFAKLSSLRRRKSKLGKKNPNHRHGKRVGTSSIDARLLKKYAL